ncbi:MAG: DUF47 family protein [Asgard group archaeon]|nr:DUF47 family protein [Asgard group archaeon]
MRLSNFVRKDSEKEIHQKMNQHLAKIHQATQSLIRAMEAWKVNDTATLDLHVGNITAEENAADKILADIWLELTKGSLKSKLRSDILTFVKRADEVAGCAKRACNNFLILHNVKLPEHILEEITKACELVDLCVKKLIEALSVYRKDIRRTVDLTTEISFIEHQVDGLYTRLKNHYFDFSGISDNFASLIIFDHAIREIEKAANSAEDASDALRSIVISEI